MGVVGQGALNAQLLALKRTGAPGPLMPVKACGDALWVVPPPALQCLPGTVIGFMAVS